MPKQSAGILLYRCEPVPAVYLVHPGGPFFAKRDDGWWTIPKGEIEAGEIPLERAIIEFEEEVGVSVASLAFVPLGEIVQKGGKRVYAWAAEASGSLARELTPRSRIISVKWPPRSDSLMHFPEVDKGAYFSLVEARRKILPAQLPFLEAVENVINDAEMSSSVPR